MASPKNLAGAPAAADHDDDDQVVTPATRKLTGQLVDYRVTKAGHGKIFTGDVVEGEHTTHRRGAIVRGVDLSIAQALEDRYFAEILEPDESGEGA